MTPELSICIPTFNRERLLDQSLRLLVPQCQGRAVEICVSDNASSDGTQAVLRRYPEVRHIHQAVNIGLDCNILAASRMARSRFVLPIGDDELIVGQGVDAILSALRARPHLLILNGWRNGRKHLPGKLRGMSFGSPVEAFSVLWDKMPLGGFVARRDAFDAVRAERYLGTFHAYSGAVWDYLLTAESPRIDCMTQTVIEFRQVPKSWATDAEFIRSEAIPRWFGLLPAPYAKPAAQARRQYLRTWGRPRPRRMFGAFSWPDFSWPEWMKRSA
jgi:glycosyltransferase involved in cell wall biosynthesis